MSEHSPDRGIVADGPTVSVRGEAAIRTEPDEAFVWITIATTDPAPAPAPVDVAKRTEALVALLDELAIPRTDRSTTGITVQEDFDHTAGGRHSLGHRAAATVSVRLTDTRLIGALIMRCSDELDARTTGPNWRVSASNPVWLEAASQAAAYAAGVELRLGPIRALAEPDHGWPGGRKMIRAASAPAGHGHDMPVETGEQEVTATIQATFALLGPCQVGS
ncbi:MAG: SIMPL domain-containing protein [Solirubrobacteraceae bacterium]